MFNHRLRASALCFLACCAMVVPALAQDIPASKQTKAGLYVTAVEASQMLAASDVVLIDVRTRAEVSFVGMPTRADVHIPLKVMPEFLVYDAAAKGYALEDNPDFDEAFESFATAHGLTSESRIVLICRSGSRSAKAADRLFDMGFTQVWTVTDGFEGDKAKEGPDAGHRMVNGWRNAGQPWAYGVRPDQAYPLATM